MVAAHCCPGKGERDVLHHQHLAGERQANACARRLGGEERHKHLARHIGRYRIAIVADANASAWVDAPSCVRVLPSAAADVDSSSIRLHGILHQIRQYLAQHILVCLHGEVGRKGDVPLQGRIEHPDAFHERKQRDGSEDRLLQQSELAVVFHESRQRLAGVVNGADALFVGCAL